MSLQKLLVLSVLACTLSSPGATSAADLSVNGHIRSGGACSLTLGNGGVIDLGNLSNNDIHKNGSSFWYDMPLTINCQHPTKVGVDTIDNRTSTKPPELTSADLFGLGTTLGYYRVFSVPLGGYGNADGQRAYAIWRDKGQTTWSGGADNWGKWGSDTTMSWKAQGPTLPAAFKTLTDVLKVQINLRKSIASTDELEIDGSATFDLVYL
ncbi:DUF1120 domain-containing protein [Burkholderia sp. Ac-20353]|uniref:DUF1120 domain-containing protein n=1 Tax=Burkholderia sp. Ac-20353 TaxID=2703894 RepID=UPI00197B2760|nr:DUF1120 domain-containing protein [Burkholderia sp. Ac-20353]MBN3788032.1 DUF1120 domain-containing protein [Burkholderia sp. Ac-20353]